MSAVERRTVCAGNTTRLMAASPMRIDSIWEENDACEAASGESVMNALQTASR